MLQPLFGYAYRNASKKGELINNLLMVSDRSYMSTYEQVTNNGLLDPGDLNA